MMATMRLISSTPEAYQIHIIFIGATSALCFHQKYATINQYLYCKLKTVNHNILYTAKNRAPKFSAGLLQILCWEPGGLPSFKVSGDPWVGNSIVTDVTISETYSPAAAKFINTDP